MNSSTQPNIPRGNVGNTNGLGIVPGSQNADIEDIVPTRERFVKFCLTSINNWAKPMLELSRKTFLRPSFFLQAT